MEVSPPFFYPDFITFLLFLHFGLLGSDMEVKPPYQLHIMLYHHIYNRGAHKSAIFLDGSDYWRMLKLLYIANSTKSFQLCNIKKKSVFELDRETTLVDIVAYCLMPNHIHIAVRSRTDLELDPGISKFMHKLCTAYSMYFNKKYDHTGTIWEGAYKEKISNDELDYMKTLIRYIHLNPYAIKEPNMTKDARREQPAEALMYSKNYDYSSFKDFLGETREQSPILSSAQIKKWR